MQKDTVKKNLNKKILGRLRVIDISLNKMERKKLIEAIIVAVIIAIIVIITVIVTVYLLASSTATDFIGLLLITWLTIIFVLITFFWQRSSK